MKQTWLPDERELQPVGVNASISAVIESHRILAWIGLREISIQLATRSPWQASWTKLAPQKGFFA
ncbi:MAG TPA: hypothetical protein VE170_07970 [Candidatus Limnocylindria bacterium]|nr:hypothetical protein [Candidatus Limnocylindria bacterium]